MKDSNDSFKGRDFNPDELSTSIKLSRALLPAAIDALCEVIEEVTSRPPNRDVVEFVGSFWLMHACDQEIYGQPESVHNLIVEPNSNWRALNSWRSRAVSLVGLHRAPVRIVDPYFKTTFLTEALNAVRARKQLRWQTVPHCGEVVSRVEWEKRRSAAAQFAKVDGGSTLRQSIALAAPVELVEAHHDLVAWSKLAVDPRAKICYSANAHQSSASFRYLLFEQRSIGTKIVFHQHGGGYGIDEQHPGEFHDTKLADVFYSWGWSRPDLGSKVRALATAAPAQHKGRKGTHYLLMSFPVTEHFYRLQAFVLPSHVEKNMHQTTTFLSSLSAKLELMIRCSGSIEYPKHTREAFKGTLEFDSLSEPGVIAASRSRLTIHNYLGTSWLETLAMNVPTVCFYDPSIFRAREAARPFIDALARVGVIHHSGAEAARFVNDLNGDPSAWWNKPEVQEARESFVARYANFKEDWLPGWIEEFERLLAE